MASEDVGKELVKEIMAYNMAEAYWLMGIRQGITNPPPPNFEGAYLADKRLNGADVPYGNFVNANLQNTKLMHANLAGARFTNANLQGVALSGTNLTGANLAGANLRLANLVQTNFTDAILTGADLSGALLIHADLTRAILTDAQVYGISAWGVQLNGAIQRNLIITPPDDSPIVVDNLEVAQFIYLLLNNEKIRDFINTIGKKGVLILGRFTEERKEILDAIREKLRDLGFVPMMFDFEKPIERDFTETIMTLAGLSRFIIADITNPKSSPLELQATMPHYMIPFVPIIQEDEEPFSMFRDLKQKYGEWVLDVLKYDSVSSLLEVLDKAIVQPALEMSDKLLCKKTEEIQTRHVNDYRFQ